MKRYDEKLIAERLYMYRQEVNHMSLNELSGISGVSSAHIGDIERGRNSPSNIEILCRLAKALNIRLDDILIDCLKY
ncbi:helix-turn-helix domain-containing protein [Tyzzerella sp. OttesenSCG-928-J15]|nr:helix-turn-helix domain-containing protein [Tyzzerella sp. OttesenSCG-928-J15]